MPIDKVAFSSLTNKQYDQLDLNNQQISEKADLIQQLWTGIQSPPRAQTRLYERNASGTAQIRIIAETGNAEIFQLKDDNKLKLLEQILQIPSSQSPPPALTTPRSVSSPAVIASISTTPSFPSLSLSAPSSPKSIPPLPDTPTTAYSTEDLPLIEIIDEPATPKSQASAPTPGLQPAETPPANGNTTTSSAKPAPPLVSHSKDTKDRLDRLVKRTQQETELRKKISALETQQSSSAKQITQLQAELVQAQTAQKAQLQIQEGNQYLKGLSHAQKDAFETQIKQLQKLLNELRAENSNLREQNVGLSNETNASKNQSIRLGQENTELKNRLKSVEQNSQQLSSTLQGLQKTLKTKEDQFNNTIAPLENQINRQLDQINQLNTKTSQLNQLQKRLAQNEASNQALLEKLNTAQSSLLKKDKKISHLQNKINQLENQLSETGDADVAMEALSNQKQKTGLLAKKLQSARAAFEKAQYRVAELEQRLSDATVSAPAEPKAITEDLQEYTDQQLKRMIDNLRLSREEMIQFLMESRKTRLSNESAAAEPISTSVDLQDYTQEQLKEILQSLSREEMIQFLVQATKNRLSNESAAAEPSADPVIDLSETDRLATEGLNEYSPPKNPNDQKAG